MAALDSTAECAIFSEVRVVIVPVLIVCNYLAARFFHPGRVAQLAEHSALNRQVEGSIPSASTIYSDI